MKILHLNISLSFLDLDGTLTFYFKKLKIIIIIINNKINFRFTLKVAETLVKFAMPPPMIRIFPVNKTKGANGFEI